MLPVKVSVAITCIAKLLLLREKNGEKGKETNQSLTGGISLIYTRQI